MKLRVLHALPTLFCCVFVVFYPEDELATASARHLHSNLASNVISQDFFHVLHGGGKAAMGGRGGGSGIGGVQGIALSFYYVVGGVNAV